MKTKKKNKYFELRMIIFYLVLIGGSFFNFWGVSTWGETNLKASDQPQPTFEKINPYGSDETAPSNTPAMKPPKH